ncbi:MAG: HD domain-containing protein, partial [Deltaproteobacteria bacterium]|nr:HD domain-containing protein [Deltaproteobacteria bacterium]
MPHQFIHDLQAGQKVNQFFLVKKKERRRTRTGKDYLDLLLADRTGTLGGKIWSGQVPALDLLFEAGEFAAVAGRVESFQDELQLTVERIKGVRRFSPEQLAAAPFDPDLLVPASPFDADSLWAEMRGWAEQDIEHPGLRALTLGLLDKHREAWLTWPAAKLYHHAYKSGLLEHSHRLVQLARQVLEVFPDLDRSLVLAGALLHDIGKIREIDGFLTARNSLEGQLIGHIALGWEMVRAAAEGIPWEDPRVLLHLEHILLSHHGQLEFGSPVLPQTPEALLVHTLDDLEGKLKMISGALEQDRGEEDFTD